MFDIGPDLLLSLCTFIGVIIGTMPIVELVRNYDSSADSGVNAYWECQEVHAALSPWKYYMNLESGRILRPAKILFNS